MATKRTEPVVIFSFGWNNMYAVPTGKVSALLDILNSCDRVCDKYLKSEENNVYYLDPRSEKVSLSLYTKEILATEPFDPEEIKDAA